MFYHCVLLEIEFFNLNLKSTNFKFEHNTFSIKNANSMGSENSKARILYL